MTYLLVIWFRIYIQNTSIWYFWNFSMKPLEGEKILLTKWKKKKTTSRFLYVDSKKNHQ